MTRVNSLSFGSIVIDNKKFSRDVLIFDDGTVEQRWGGLWMFGSHSIKRNEVERLLRDEPEIVIIGTGTNGKARLDSEAGGWLKTKNLEVLILPSYEAVTKLNEIVDQGKKVACLIHITC